MKQELILSKATETLKTSVSLAKLYSFSACSLAVPTSKTYNIQGFISENIQQQTYDKSKTSGSGIDNISPYLACIAGAWK